MSMEMPEQINDITIPAPCSANELAHYILRNKNLSDWQIEFFAVALEESAEFSAIFTNMDCLNQLVQMNSTHRGSIKEVVLAVTGLDFSCTWQGEYGLRKFDLNYVQWTAPLTQQEFDAQVDAHGWGSDAHRRSLGVLDAAIN